MILGGSTNAVLHLIAIAHSVGIKLTIDDFQSVSDRVPFIADLKPSGKYVMEDVYKLGGIPSMFSALRHKRKVLNLLPHERGAGLSAQEQPDRWEQYDRYRSDPRGEP